MAVSLNWDMANLTSERGRSSRPETGLPAMSATAPGPMSSWGRPIFSTASRDVWFMVMVTVPPETALLAEPSSETPPASWPASRMCNRV